MSHISWSSRSFENSQAFLLLSVDLINFCQFLENVKLRNKYMISCSVKSPKKFLKRLIARLILDFIPVNSLGAKFLYACSLRKHRFSLVYNLWANQLNQVPFKKKLNQVIQETLWAAVQLTIGSSQPQAIPP